jgi:hypothetical protein
MFNSAYHSFMNETMTRVYELAAAYGVRTQADLARKLNTSSQKIKNWETRGISKEGALDVAREFKASATWIMDGLSEKLDSNNLLQQKKLEYEVKPAMLVAGIEIKSNEAILLEHYRKLSNTSKEILDMTLNRLYELEYPNDAKASGKKIKKEVIK